MKRKLGKVLGKFFFSFLPSLSRVREKIENDNELAPKLVLLRVKVESENL